MVHREEVHFETGGHGEMRDQDIFTKFFQIKKAKKKMSKRPKTAKQKTIPKRKVKKRKILKKIKGKKRKVSHKLRKAKKRIKKYTR